MRETNATNVFSQSHLTAAPAVDCSVHHYLSPTSLIYLLAIPMSVIHMINLGAGYDRSVSVFSTTTNATS